MGNWYRVTKRINGRLYDYWQRTYRVGKSVKTENKYIGPSGKSGPPAASPYRRTTGVGSAYAASIHPPQKILLRPHR